MSGYGKMNASPFWKRVMAATGILCIVTLILPTVYYIKYVSFDYPREEKIAQQAGLPDQSLTKYVIPHAGEPPAAIENVRVYMNIALGDSPAVWRLWAVDQLERMCRLPGAQVLHWMECLNAKLTLERVAQADKSPAVRKAAAGALDALGRNGVIFSR